MRTSVLSAMLYVKARFLPKWKCESSPDTWHKRWKTDGRGNVIQYRSYTEQILFKQEGDLIVTTSDFRNQGS